MSEANSWDQQPGETDAQYEMFLVYLGLGPGRSMRHAYRIYVQDVLKSEAAPSGPSGNYKAATVKWRWVERANDHDIAVIREEGRQVIHNYLRGLQAVASKAAAAAEEMDVDDPAWERILESLAFVAEQLRPVRESGLIPGLPPTGQHVPVQEPARSLPPADRESVR